MKMFVNGLIYCSCYPFFTSCSFKNVLVFFLFFFSLWSVSEQLVGFCGRETNRDLVLLSHNLRLI